MVEVSRDPPALREAMQHQFLDQRKALIESVLQHAVDRGEIKAEAITEELWDLLPGYLIFRSIVPQPAAQPADRAGARGQRHHPPQPHPSYQLERSVACGDPVPYRTVPSRAISPPC